MSLLIMLKPAPFPYKITKVVPWHYDTNTFVNGREEPVESRLTNPANIDVSNIAGASRITCSRRIFTPAPPYEEVVEEVSKGKRIEVLQPNKALDITKDIIPHREADEFLKLINRNDYKVMDQLYQTPSKISILSLLLNLEDHREDLMKLIMQDHVAQHITVDQFNGVIYNITACHSLSLNDEKLLEEGRDHN